MKLLFLNHNYRYGGTYYRAMPMAEQLAARGHAVTLMTVSNRCRWRVSWSNEKGVRLAETPNLGQDVSGQGYGPPDNLFRLGHAIFQPYDVIQMFDHKPNATFPGFVGRMRGATVVADWADWWGGPGGINDVPKRRMPAIGAFEQWWEERSKRWADGVVTISSVLKQRAVGLGIPAENVLHLPTGAASDRIQPVPLLDARRRLDLPVNRRIVGFIGIGQGDLEIALNAIRPLNDVWLMVVGHKSPHVRLQAERLGVADRLWQTGFIDDHEVSDYLGCANLMVLPMKDTAANRGRLPNKLLDYLCAGRPTVASPVGDVRSVVERYGVGILAQEAQFSFAVDYLLSHPDISVGMGKQARATATITFTWPKLVEQLERFYDFLRNNR